jgi:hypothetical protein
MRLRPLVALTVVLGACDTAAPPPPTTTTSTTVAPHATATPPASTGPAHWVADAGECRPGRHPQPGGAFVAVVECRPESGATLAVVRDGGDGDARRTAGWPADAPAWQDGAWTRDVTSLAWADGDRLFVATADRVGAGGLWDLDVAARSARQVMPAGDAVSVDLPGPGYVILGIDPERRALRYTIAPWTPDDRGATFTYPPAG